MIIEKSEHLAKRKVFDIFYSMHTHTHTDTNTGVLCTSMFVVVVGRIFDIIMQ
jgi:hypothetical protein